MTVNKNDKFAEIGVGSRSNRRQVRRTVVSTGFRSGHGSGAKPAAIRTHET
jgi:hypothetical protein